MSANKPPFDGEWVRLEELCAPKQWKSLKQSEMTSDGYPVYGANGVIGYYSEYNHAEETILVGCRGTCGEVNLCAPYSYVTSNAMCLDRLSDRVDRDYLICFLKAYNFGRVIGGTSQPQITKTGISSIEVPLFSLEKQIAIRLRLKSILDELVSCKALLAKLDTLVNSRFVEMFGGLNSADLRPLKDVCSIITDGTHQPPKFVDRGIPFLFVSNITSDAVDYETNKFISVEDYEQLIRRTPIEVGDVLVSAVGSFGHPAIVEDDRPFCFQRHIAYLKPRHDLIDSSYLHAALLSGGSQRYMDRCAKGAAQRTVTLKSFREMKVPLPPLALQQEFASFVAEVDKSRFIVKQKIEKLQMLYDSLAQEYFG